MKHIIVYAAVAISVATTLPVLDDLQDSGYTAYEYEAPAADKFSRHRSPPDTKFEDAQLFHVAEEKEARSKRATCDELRFSSKWLTAVNHSVCAVHCITRGYKCGKYVNNICKCRN